MKFDLTEEQWIWLKNARAAYPQRGGDDRWVECQECGWTPCKKHKNGETDFDALPSPK